MKVGPIDLPQTAAAGAVAGSERRAPGTASGGKSAEPSAKVDLSVSPSAIGQGVEGSFDQAKVDRIAQAIRDGKFEINPEAIADKLIANAQELLGKSGH